MRKYLIYQQGRTLGHAARAATGSDQAFLGQLLSENRVVL